MKPRYRKVAPENKTFSSEEEMRDFMRNLMEAQQEIFGQTKANLKHYGFDEINHDGHSSKRADGVVKLLKKIDKFCPHFTTFTPTFKHFLFPSIGVGCCHECLIGFMPLLMADSSGCDLCGVGEKNDMYVEMSIPLGYGSLSINLGTYCCADIFTKGN